MNFPPASEERRPPSISVALCTYNGARFLREQLDSIARQTRLPDEVLIRDDGSRDDTLHIATAWAAQVPFRVRVEANAENLRTSRNFARAIAEAAGPIIVLCDQDDVWLPSKLARLTRFFEDHPAAEAVFTDGWVVDEALQRRQLLSESVGFRGAGILHDIAFGGIVARLAARATATGATMALRASLRDAILPLPDPWPRYLVHDGWIAIVAALRGTLGFLDEPLILYRRHADQQVGLTPEPGRGSPRWRQGAARTRLLAHNAAEATLLRQILHDRFPQFAGQLRPFDEREGHQIVRHRLPASRPRRLLPVLRELLSGRYGRFAQGIKTALGDLLN